MNRIMCTTAALACAALLTGAVAAQTTGDTGGSATGMTRSTDTATNYGLSTGTDAGSPWLSPTGIYQEPNCATTTGTVVGVGCEPAGVGAEGMRSGDSDTDGSD